MAKDNWLPQEFNSLGVKISTSSASSSSIKNLKKPLSLIAFSLNTLIPPAFLMVSSEPRIAARESTGGLETCHASADAMGLKLFSILNRDSLSCPHQPAKRGSNSFL